MDLLTRRELVQRGGLLAGALALASGSRGEVAAVAQQVEPGFSAERRETYTALVDAVGAVPSSPVDSSRTADATEAFATFYESQDSVVQGAVDLALDSLDEASPERKFANRDKADRVVLLRGWRHDTDSTALPNGHPAKKVGTRGDLRRLLADRALSYAVLPFTDRETYSYVPVALD